jgi:hypothetical protein
MTPYEVKEYYKSQYMFKKITGMSSGTLGNWLKWGYVPLLSQLKIEKLTNGALKSDWQEREK